MSSAISRGTKFFGILLLVAFMLSTNVPSVYAAGGTISGTISYHGTYGISGIVVTATARVGGATYTGTTISDGTYAIVVPDDGEYDVTAATSPNYSFSAEFTNPVTITDASVPDIDFAATGSYAISGTVLYHGTGMAGVTFHATGRSSSVTLNAAITGSDGQFTISDVGPDIYDLTFDAVSGFTITPDSSSVVTITNASESGVNYTAAGDYSISGTILYHGTGLAGVSFHATGRTNGRTFSASATGTNGQYSISDLGPDIYDLTFDAVSGFTITPDSSSVVTITNANQTGVNYTAAGDYAISGTVLYHGTGMSGVVFHATGRTNGRTFTASATGTNGQYTISNLGPDTYDIAFDAVSGFTIAPDTSAVVTITNASQSGVNYTATGSYSISGTILYQSVGLSGVTFHATGRTNGRTFDAAATGTNGQYSIANLGPDIYDLTFDAVTGYSISPNSSAVVTITNASQSGVDYTATGLYSISGTILYHGTGLSGVVFHATGRTNGLTFDDSATGSDGAFSISGLGPDTYDLTFDAVSGFTITPDTSAVVIITNASQTGVNYTANGDYSISGTILYHGTGMAGVTFHAAGRTNGRTFDATVTGANGQFSISNLGPNVYDLTFDAVSGYTITPDSSAVVTITNASQSGVNYTAVGDYSISGTILYHGVGLSGVTFHAAGRTNGRTFNAAATGSNGIYTISNLGPDTYDLTFDAVSGYTITPNISSVVIITGASQTGINYTAAGLYSISGTITDINGDPIQDVSVSVPGVTAVLTNVLGQYTINGLGPRPYLVTPEDASYTFHTSATNPVTITTSSVTGINFTGLLSNENTDATLKSLTNNFGVFSWAFKQGISTYNFSAAHRFKDLIILTPATNSNYATLKVFHNGVEIMPSSDGYAIPLTVGSNNIVTFVVTAHDGSTKKTYTVTMTLLADDYPVRWKSNFYPDHITATVGTTYTYTLEATNDYPKRPVTFSWEAGHDKPAWLTVKTNLDGSVTLTGTPTIADIGQVPVWLWAEDTSVSPALTVKEHQYYIITVSAPNKIYLPLAISK